MNHSTGTNGNRPAARRLRFESLEDRWLLTTLPAGFSESVIAADLTSPVTFDIEDSGRIWLGYQDGRIQVIQDDVLLPHLAIDLETDGSGERGLLGIELDRNFSDNGYIYVYYTAALPNSHSRLSRLTVDPTTQNTILAESEMVIFEFPDLSTIGQPIWRLGGAIHTLLDGTMVLQVGDHQTNAPAQDYASPLGKILRFNPDGSAVPNNPFYNANDGITWRDYVYAAGLRNPFSGDVDDEHGVYFVNDVGQATWEEINDATIPGLNFGWPGTEGSFNAGSFPQYTNPFLAYNHSEDCSITGGAFYRSAVSQFPPEYDGKYFFSQFCAGNIMVVDHHDPEDVDVFLSGTAFPMAIEIGPDGSLYYLARGAGDGGQPGIETGQLLKVQFAAEISPQIVQHPEDTLISVGYDATLSVSVAGSPPFAYQWQRHNGAEFVDVPEAVYPTLVLNNVSLADDGAQFRVVITNEYGPATSNIATLDVTADTPPTVEIDLHNFETKYRAGDVIEFSGMATDLEDGELDGESMLWQVDFHHDTHLHPFVAPTSGTNKGQFVIPTNSETSPNVWFRIHLYATDSAGLTTHVTRDIQPFTSNFTVETSAGGGQIYVDGQPKSSPMTITGVVNVKRTLEAPPVINVGGAIGRFIQWLDGETERRREIFTPEQDTAYVALYEEFAPSLVFLSELTPINGPPLNGWGPLEYDMSNGELEAGDGVPMSIGGIRYLRGLGTNAYSEIRYDLSGAYKRFIADIGIDDDVGVLGSAVFRVFVDDNEVPIYESDVRRGWEGRIAINLDVTGAQVLRLVVDSDGGTDWDHADWANARLIPVGAGTNIHVNFQPSGSPTPSGYVADGGMVFGNRGGGLQYGWSTNHAAGAADRNSSSVEERLETSVLVQSNQRWEIALPNGSYAVTVSVGDATANGGGPTNNTVNVEGNSYWSATSLAGNEFFQQTKIISVADGRLTVNVGASNTTRINYVEITPVPDPNAEAIVFPFFAADVNLNGRLTLADALAFAAGWGNHNPGLTYQQRVRSGDLDFDGDTDGDDWLLFSAQWNREHSTSVRLAALLNPIAGDFNRDGTVNDDDFGTWKASYRSLEELAADGNGDGIVGAADFTVWRDHYGSSIDTGTGASAAIVSVGSTINEEAVTTPSVTPSLQVNKRTVAKARLHPAVNRFTPRIALTQVSLLNSTCLCHDKSHAAKGLNALDMAFESTEAAELVEPNGRLESLQDFHTLHRWTGRG